MGLFGGLETRSVELLMEDLKSNRTKKRLKAANELGRRGYKATSAPLQLLFSLSVQDPDETVRLAAKTAGVQILIGALLVSTTEDIHASDMNRSAAQALQNIVDPRTVEPLIQVISQEHVNAYIMDDALVALAHQGDSRAVEPLKRILSNPDHYSPSTPVYAARALRRIGEPDGISFAVSKGFLYGEEETDELIERVVDAWVQGNREQFDSAFASLKSSADEKKAVSLLHMRFDGYFVGSSSVSKETWRAAKKSFDSMENALRQQRGYDFIKY